MLLIVHNLPKDIRYIDVKQLIQDDCGLREAILDNLMDEAGGKRITVGIAEEEDAAILVRKLNGMLYKNRALYVEDVRQKKFTSKTSIPAGLQPPLPRPGIPYPVAPPTELMGMNYNNMPFYLTKASNTIMNIDKSQDNQGNSNNQTYQQNTPSSYQAQNQWSYPMNVLYPNQVQDSSMMNVSQTYDSYQNNRDVSDRRDNQTNWRDNKSPPSKRHENFGNMSQRQSRSDTKYSRHEDDQRSRDRVRDRSWDDRTDFEFSRRSRSRRTNRDRDRESHHERQSDREQNAYDRNDRQREREFDRNERYNKPQPQQNINIWSKRPNATSTSLSSNPENSTFSKSNINVFGTTATFGYGGQTSNNRMRFNQPNRVATPRGNYPPAKKPRFDQNVNSKQIVKNPVSQLHAVNSEADFQKMMRRVTNWRNESSAFLAKQIIKNASTTKLNNYMFKAVLKKLKDCITLRLDVILGSNVPTSSDEILRSYRTKFDERSDVSFFKGVMEKVEREVGQNSEGSASTSNSTNNTNKEQPRDSRQFRTEQNRTKPTDKSQPAQVQQNALPTQSQGATKKNMSKNIYMPKVKGNSGDRKELRKIKKNQVLEYQEDYYKMDPILQNAVDDEIEQLVQCYLTACKPSSDEDEETVRKRILTNTVGEFKKVIKLHVTKRVLNITEGLCVRIFPTTNKQPNRDVLSAFLQRHGVTSFKKSDVSKMFIAVCDSYDSYDKLLAMQTATFGNDIGIQIKPIYLTGPQEKNAKNTEQNEGDVSKDGDEVDLTLSDLNESLENYDDPDIVIIENKNNDVVVIHDESINLGNTSFEIDDKLPTDISDKADENVTKSNDENTNNENPKSAKDIENADANINSNNEDVANDPGNKGDKEIKDATVSDNDNSQNKVDITKDTENKDDENDKETKDTESVDEILNSVDNIDEDDLEDF